LRIAVLHQALGRYGGAERLCINVCRELSNRGHEVGLFWHDWKLPVDWQGLLSRYDEFVGRTRIVPWHVYKLGNIIDELRSYDVVLVMHHMNPPVGIRVVTGLRGRVPCIWYAGEPNRGLWEKYIAPENTANMKEVFVNTVRDIYGRAASIAASTTPLYQLATGALCALDFAFVRSYMRIIAQSIAAKDALSRIYRVPSSKLDVIYPGVYAPRIDYHGATAYPQNDGTGFFMAVGAIEAHKNYETMFRALKALIQLQPSARLVVVGVGSQSGLLRSQYHALPIVFKGYVSTDYLSLLYSVSRCLVHTAYWEPFGLTPIEAAYFGKPSIVSRLGGPAETVRNGVTGIHVDPSNSEEICGAMNLMMNSDICAKMGKNALENVRQNFTMEKMIGSLEKVLEEIC